MSIEAMSYVKTLTITKPAEKLILILLADRISNETGECFPGQKRLAKEASMSERTVRRHMKALTDAGLLTSRKRFCPNGNPNTSAYEIVGFLDWLNCAEKCASDQWSVVTSGQKRPAVNSGSTTGQNRSSPPDNVVRQTQRGTHKEPKDMAIGDGQQADRDFALEAPEPKKPKGQKAKKKSDPPYTASFERYWQAYPHKRKKARAAEFWSKLDEQERELVIASIPKYVADCKKCERSYQNGDTYLSAKTWHDYVGNKQSDAGSDDESLIKLVVNYGKDQTSWGPRLEERLGPPPGKPGCQIKQWVIDRAREILRAEKGSKNMAYA